MTGALFLVSTPIGNLQDLTLRALETLRSADVIAAEDTRRARILLNAFDITKEVLSYHAFNEHEKTGRVLELVEAGRRVAVISDAGTPAVADPGFFIVREALRRGIEPVVIPGVSALTFSATASGLPVDKFAFWGFVPVKSGRKRAFFEKMAREDQTVFCFESPYRIAKTLAEVAEVLGPERPVAVIREATKIHEEILRGLVGELLRDTAQKVWKGEIVLGIAPDKERASAGEEVHDGGNYECE